MGVVAEAIDEGHQVARKIRLEVNVHLHRKEWLVASYLLLHPTQHRQLRALHVDVGKAEPLAAPSRLEELVGRVELYAIISRHRLLAAAAA